MRRIFGSKTDEVTGGWRVLHSERSSIIFTLHEVLLGWSNQGDEVGEACSRHGRVEICIQNFSLKAWKKETTNCYTYIIFIQILNITEWISKYLNIVFMTIDEICKH
jgi:hypothetical protein